jgi:WS/DGAT/MGAT family acyltransferase
VPPIVSSIERLSALDASFLQLEDRNTHMHIAATLLFEAAPLILEDGGLDIERIRDFVGTRLHMLPRYRQRLVYSPVAKHPFWVDDDRFNLFYHVRHTSLPRPGTIRQLKRMVGRLLSQQLDRGKPLWELWVIEGLEGGRFAVLSKTHHSMADGLSGADILTVLLSSSSTEDTAAPPAWVPKPTPTGRELLSSELLHHVRTPWRKLQGAVATLRDPEQALGHAVIDVASMSQALRSALTRASPTPFNAPIGPHRRFDWTAMDLGEIKAIRRRCGGTLNDVVLAIVAGATRTFLQRRGTQVDNLVFRAMVPVSRRGDGPRGSMGNKVSLVFSDLPVDEKDPFRRLARVAESTTRLKSSGQVHGTEMLEELGELTSTMLITEAARLAVMVRAYNLVVTNVPGPQVPLYFLGAPLEACFPTVPLYSNQGLGIALFSYNGALYWGVHGDWDAMPDLHDYVLALEQAFEELSRT